MILDKVIHFDFAENEATSITILLFRSSRGPPNVVCNQKREREAARQKTNLATNRLGCTCSRWCIDAISVLARRRHIRVANVDILPTKKECGVVQLRADDNQFSY